MTEMKEGPMVFKGEVEGRDEHVELHESLRW